MNLTIKEVESYYSRIKKSYPSAEESENLQIRLTGNLVRLYSTIEGDSTNGLIHLDSGILTTSSGYRDAGEGPNRILELPFLLDGMTIKVDGHITFTSNDLLLPGRITSMSAHLNSHTVSHHERPLHLEFSPPKPGDTPLYPFDGLSGGFENLFRIPVNERVFREYSRFTEPLRSMTDCDYPFYLDVSIFLHYRDSSLLRYPNRPDEILVKARARSTHENLKYELKLTND